MAASSNPALKGSPKLGSYLRKLRNGYGYSLRRVEERARAEGGEIDNSQLSRYEKGICYPSFDKLRVLASVFNVSIQSFSDVVDLEEYEELRPDSNEPAQLVEGGKGALRSGDYGRAFVHFEAALDALLQQAPGVERQREMAKVRINQAVALQWLGKLSLAEQELRQAMRTAELLSPEARAKALLSLSNLHADQGDHFLAEMEAERAYLTAQQIEHDELAAMASHMLGKVLVVMGRSADAIERHREAAQLYERVGDRLQATVARIDLGDAYIALGKKREGQRLLQMAVQEARDSGSRRVEALAWANLGNAYYQSGEARRATSCFRESDALSVCNNDRYSDILFYNAYYQWKMAAADDNPTREKIAFGRLKALRSTLERRFPEVDSFDAFVEGGR